MHELGQFTLRTTDVAAARGFYGAVVGGPLAITELPSAAVARGARPHWLGQVAVEDVEAVAAQLVARGAMRLGPMGDGVVIREPGGAVMGLTREGGEDARIVWHQLHTAIPAQVASIYGELFGWSVGAPEVIGEHGVHRPFAWRADGAIVGTIADLAGRPHVHPQWLYYVGVPSLDDAMAAVRAGGGIVLGPWMTPDGARVAVCDDPQGAAFGLMQR